MGRAGENYIPDEGHIVWLQFNPQKGHEQAGHRPAVVLSPLSYNKKTGLMLCVPLSTKIKGYPFEVLIKGDLAQVAIADQIKSLDWRARNAQFKAKASSYELAEIRARAIVLLKGSK